jgi:hypothetical protein
MINPPDFAAKTRHYGPPLGIVAIVFTLLFNAGLYPVTMFGGKPYFPGPWESAEVIQAYFLARPMSASICAFFQFGSAISLGIFTAAITSQLRFLGAKGAAVYIALLGGLLTVCNIIASTFFMWTMAHPGIANDARLIDALYFMQYAFGGPGFSVALGLLLAGVSVTAGFMKMLPKWIVIFGIVLAVFGELSWLNLIFPKALFLVPLTRFPGFVWLIAAGFKLPRTKNISYR